jgi:hypothetical protein
LLQASSGVLESDEMGKVDGHIMSKAANEKEFLSLLSVEYDSKHDSH